jgi:hypothetical protein
MKRIAVMLLAVALLTGIASADTLVFTGAVYDAFITVPVPVGDGSESLIAFDLYFVNKGDTNKAFDTFDDQSNPAFTGITGALHQQDGPALLAWTPTMSQTAFATALDSHFITLDANLINVVAPNETRGLAPSTEAVDAASPFTAFGAVSFGDYMGGVFTDLTQIGVSPRFLAHLVITDPGLELGPVAYGTGLVDNFYLASGPGGGEVVQFGIGVIPEPATMSLLAIGGIAALIRRRK